MLNAFGRALAEHRDALLASFTDEERAALNKADKDYHDRKARQYALQTQKDAMKNETIEGTYTMLKFTGSGLTITLTEQGRAELLENLGSYPDWSDESQFLQLLEEHICNNGIEEIQPEEIAALTESLLFCRECERDDEGELTVIHGPVFWYPAYMLRLYTHDLLRFGEIVFDAEPQQSEAQREALERAAAHEKHTADAREIAANAEDEQTRQKWEHIAEEHDLWAEHTREEAAQ